MSDKTTATVMEDYLGALLSDVSEDDVLDVKPENIPKSASDDIDSDEHDHLLETSPVQSAKPAATKSSSVIPPSSVIEAEAEVLPEQIKDTLSSSEKIEDDTARASVSEPAARYLTRTPCTNSDSPSLPPLEHSQRTQKQPRVPNLDETEALREEQKRRLQKLLSKPEVPPPSNAPEQQLAREIAEEFHEEDFRSEKDQIDQAEPTISTQLQTSAIKTDGEWSENGRPPWAQERFDALLFDVDGLTLAVPLVALGQIVRYTKEELTPIFGQSEWFMGLVNSNLGRLRLVNTALFVMPEKYDPKFESSAEFAISLDGENWALAVNKVNQPVRLDPDEIKWRSERSKRPWLAGTVKSKMCALLDVSGLAAALNASDSSNSDPSNLEQE